MSSISARFAAWYAVGATATLAVLFVAGYKLLESRLIHGLDLLNVAEFQQIKARLGDDYRTLSAADMDARIRETTEYASVLFYFAIEAPGSGVMFSSSNLGGRPIPDVRGERAFNAQVTGIGELRVNEFVLPPFDISIGTSLAQVRETMEGYTEVCVALLMGMLLTSVAIGFALSGPILKPLRLIRETASRISSDNLSERIPVGDVSDEISGLAILLNQMFDRIESAFNRLRHFTAEASHELKTPLSLVRLHAEKMLVEGNLAPANAEAVLVQLEELGRLSRIIDELLFLSRAETIEFDLHLQTPQRFLEGFRQDAIVLAEHNGCRFIHTHEGEGLVAFEEKWLRQVLLNLLTNALKASPPDGLITLRSSLKAGLWRVSVEDEGPGVTPEQYEAIFEPFVRFANTATEQSGSGLGLAISRSIVRLHRGRIFAAAAKTGCGLSVTFEIPMPDA